MSLTRPKHILRLLSAGILILVLLSGCIEVRVESEFDADMGARHIFEMTMERSALEQLQAMGGGEDTDTFEDTEDIEREAEEAGMDFERIDTDERVGWRVSKRVDDSSDVGAALNEIFQGVDSESDAPTSGFSGTYTRDGDTYRLNVTVVSDEVFEGQEEDAEDLGMDMSAIFTFIYVATMPGEITETNGTRVDDNTVRWNLPLTGTTTMTAVSQGGSGAGGTSTLLLIGLIALVLIGGAVAFYLFSQRRRQPELGAAPAAPMATDAGMETDVPPPGAGPYAPPPAQPDPWGPAADPGADTRPLPPRPEDRL